MTSRWPSLTEFRRHRLDLGRFPGLWIAVREKRLRWKPGLVVRGLAEPSVAWTR